MRLYTFLFLFSIVFATVIYAEDDYPEEDDNGDEAEGDEMSTTRATTRRTIKPGRKSTKRPQFKSDDSPQCHSTTTSDGQPAYFCERKVDGETRTFGIKFEKDKIIHCGEFQDEKLNGPGSGLVLGYDVFGQRLRCANYVDGKLDGPTSWYMFNDNVIELGHTVENIQEGASITFYSNNWLMSRLWYVKSQCKSKIEYDRNGEEINRNVYGCQ